jgi:hypothetical protein
MKANVLRSVGTRLWVAKGLLCLLAGVTIGSDARAQSTDRANPTPLTSAEIQGVGTEQKSAYYYAFQGGPGSVSASLEAKTKKGSKHASVGIELFDAHSNSLTSALLNDGLGGGKDKLDQLIGDGLGRILSSLGSKSDETKQRTSRVKLKEKQTLTLRVTVGPGIETYTVKLEGAVEFGQPTIATDPAPATVPVTEPPATDPATTPTEQQPPPDEQPPVANQQPAIVKIPGKSKQETQKPAVVKIPGKKPQQ